MERVQKWPQTFRERFSSTNSIGQWVGPILDGSKLRSSKEETLDEKIKAIRKALKGTSRHSPKRILYLSGLTYAFEFRYSDTDQSEDLEQWIQYAQEQLDISNGTERRDAMKNFAHALLKRYSKFGQMADLDKSIQYGEQVLQEASVQSLGSLTFLYIHSHALRTRYMRRHQSSDLEQAIMYAHQVLDAEPEGSHDTAIYLANLSHCLFHQFERTGDESDLESSIRLAQQAVDITPLGHQTRAAHLGALGFHLGSRYERSGSTTDLERSLQLQLEAVDNASKRGRVKPSLLYGLAVAFKRRYDTSRVEDELEQYIRYTQQAVDSAHPGNPDLHVYVRHLAAGYGKRYKRNEQVADLEKVIEIEQQALHMFPAGHPARPQFLASLCIYFQKRAAKLDQPKDISQAICYAKEAVGSVPEDHTQRSYLLNTLAGGYAAAFYKLYENTDLDHCIKYMQAALSCSKEGDPNRGQWYLFLGQALSCRSGIFIQQSDREHAIEYLQEALKWFPVHDKRRVSALRALGDAYYYGYGQNLSAEKVLLDQAMQQYQSALNCIPDKDKQSPELSIKLSRVLIELFDRSYQEDDIDGALAHCNNALLATEPDNKRMRMECFANFGDIYDRKFRDSGRIADLQQSIQWYQQALELTESDTASRHSLLMSIGTLCRLLFEHSQSAEDLEMSDESLEQVFREGKLLQFRLFSGSTIVFSAVLRGLWSRAAKYLDEIIPLLPDIIPPSRSRDDSQRILRSLSDIADVPATVYLNVGRSPLEALEALESFRGIIANLQIDAKSDISTLKGHHPRLWNEYSRCRDEISLIGPAVTAPLHTGSNIQDVASYNAASSRRQQLFQKLQHLQAEIRNCAGFEKFLLPPRGEDITALAEEGPLVCLNINDHGSHAFLVTPAGVEVTPLPRFAEARIRSSVAVFNSRVYLQRRDVEIIESDEDDVDKPGLDKTAKELQYWWVHVVKPVLKKLGLLRETSGEERLPRIWWVGGGIMSLIPLHATRVYATDPMENAISHVVSSYVPTLKILQSLRRRPPISISHEARKLVVVSMPVTPGTYGTLNTEKEADAITKHSKSVADVTTLTRPTKDTVIEALKSSMLAHFACHGSVNFAQPGKSALIVGRDTMQRLTVNEVLDTIMHSGAEIAYLSACSTAEIEPGNLIHESIHLASAFQLAGFKSVIGTLWRADDNTAVAIAGKFYDLLFQEEEITGRSVAYALHEAVVQYQHAAEIKAGALISKWAPFIHFGC